MEKPMSQKVAHCTEVRFVSFLSGKFTTIAVINLPKRKLAKPTFVHLADKFT
jgi:hypothetical protein